MSISDGKMMLLEQLTYMDRECFNQLGLNYPSDSIKLLETIQKMNDSDINSFTIKSDDTSMTSQEWREIMHAVKHDPEFDKLICKDYNNEAGAFCFLNKETNEGVVAFRGTLKLNDEWQDNVLQVATSDTPAQIVALNYVNSLTQYDGICVVGHSKGGNKAQYVALLADNVNVKQCVSMDGEGFSKEFIEKYSAQIQEKGQNITNYSYKNDFVNIMLHEVPGSTQKYLEGNATGARCHFSNSMYKLVRNLDGTFHVVVAECDQNPGMKYLHDFTCYVADNMPLSERQKTASFLAEILYLSQVKNQGDKAIDYVLDNPDEGAKILAWLFRYINEKGLTDEQVGALMNAFGLKGVKLYDTEVTTLILAAKNAIIKHPELVNNELDEIMLFLHGSLGLVGNVILPDNDKIKKIKRIIAATSSEYKEISKPGYAEDSANKGFTYSGKEIRANTEQLLSQAQRLDDLQKRFDAMFDDLKAVTKLSSYACSENMSNDMKDKVNMIEKKFRKVSDLLYSGARAAYTAATSYESIDKALAKQISNL